MRESEGGRSVEKEGRRRKCNEELGRTCKNEQKGDPTEGQGQGWRDGE